MKPNQFLPITLDGPPGAAQLRADGGAALTEERRVELLRQLRAGSGPQRLELEAIVFVQRAAPNRNFTRFVPAALPAFAASFANVPFLRDHEHRDFEARGGTVTRAQLLQHPDGVAIHARLELVKPWAIEAALDGTLDRFSIAWQSPKGPTCSACGKAMLSGNCIHFPGREVNGTPVEALYGADAQGIEISALSMPAVDGTGVEAIRAALAAHRAGGDLAFDLAREREAHTATRKALAEVQLELGKLRAEMIERNVTSVIEAAYNEGRILPTRDEEGKEVDGPMEHTLREMAAKDPAAALAYVRGLPRLAPIGIAPLSIGTEPPRTALPELSDVQREINRRLGVSEADFNRYNERK